MAEQSPSAGRTVAFVGKLGERDRHRFRIERDAVAQGWRVIDPADAAPDVLVVGEGRGGSPPADAAKLVKKYPHAEVLDAAGFARRLLPEREAFLEELAGERLGHVRWDALTDLFWIAGAGVDLSGADLQGADLYGAKLAQAALDGADFRWATLQYAELPPLRGAKLDSANATNVYLSDLCDCSLCGADLRKAWFFWRTETPVVAGCDFTAAKLAGARLESGYGPRLTDCRFREADLSDAEMERAAFDRADFTGADLTRVHAAEAAFTDGVFAGATLRRADLRGASLRGANLRNADLLEAVLKGADLTGADVAGADFQDAVLTGANLAGVDVGKAKNFAPPVAGRTPGPRILALAAAVAGSKKFRTTAVVEPGEGEHAILTLSARLDGSRLGVSAQSVHIRGIEKGADEASDLLDAPTVEQGLLNLSDRWPKATLRLDAVAAEGAKGARGERLLTLATAAWAEAFGAGADDDLDAVRDAQRAGAEGRKARLVADLRASGTRAWNALGYREHDRYGALGAVDLSGAELAGIELRRADLRGSRFCRAKLKGAEFGWADLQGADFREADLAGAELSGADLQKADLRGADLTGAKLDEAKLQGADLTGAALDGAKLDDAEYDEATALPAGFDPPESMVWKGAFRPVAAVEPGSLDFPTFLRRIERQVDYGRLSDAVKMLRAEKFELFADVTGDGVAGVVRSQSNPGRVYACRLAADGRFGCGTQNLRPCGGLGGKPCKHLLVLVVGLAKAGKLDPAAAAGWLDASRGRDPEFDKEAAGETLLRYKGAEAGDVDWRPTETVPEDFYAL